MKRILTLLFLILACVYGCSCGSPVQFLEPVAPEIPTDPTDKPDPGDKPADGLPVAASLGAGTDALQHIPSGVTH